MAKAIPFKLVAPYSPAGDQPEAIAQLVAGLERGDRCQTLLGVTGSGKTYTMASTIARAGRPALIFAPNKTLAAQLFSEFKQFFPENAVEYFVSYYDYYQPEAYVPERDLFIDKDAKINEELEKLRLSATRCLLERRDTIVIASVSCIYGLGDPSSYMNLSVTLKPGQSIDRAMLLRDLVAIQYQRNHLSFEPGIFRVRGDVVEVYPAYEDVAYRIELWGDEVERLSKIDPLRGVVIEKLDELTIWPKTHYVTPEDKLKAAIRDIKAELEVRENEFRAQGKIVELQRLHQRVIYDVEMMKEMGVCSGIENYSRFLDGRQPGQPPHTLLDYFPEDFIVFMDESHVATGQLHGMYNGDRSRKTTLVDYGFRLPSALDNRPLKFEEFESRVKQVIYVSATPGSYELEQSGGAFVEQVVRPTGLVDPMVEVRPVGTQVDDLLEEIRKVVARDERVLVTVLTKKLAEQLTAYYQELGVKAEYLHSEIDTLERVELLKNLRRGVFDVLVGINLLREGLDLPEVSLVAILDADKEGFLRNTRSLIQTIGRAARNVSGKAILYADVMTGSMQQAIGETERRRNKQLAHNAAHGITPETVKRNLDDVMGEALAREFINVTKEERAAEEPLLYLEDKHFEREVAKLEKRMKELASQMKFEDAAELRDRILRARRERLLDVSGVPAAGPEV
ncbi:MAG: excinuclease ABC subunit UvrB [Geothrix sp.]|uniref:UvrABC system protein B n=1 Tax=Candidatus Geothrix odensensis TaxID=2954440 RepID=A0A936K5Y2_9BACT|nr:excinuclease ABC subunit UvrB [Candidatus Geothrix odensensis]MBK8788689.1 excinuclease ABC subunit UvrB [Holophagaceae bacterium]MCC6514204.1 excinuclease ABC subunit UvrB [Geothrix sp.]